MLRSRGAGILLITHDRSISDRLSQRTYTISNGTNHEWRVRYDTNTFIAGKGFLYRFRSSGQTYCCGAALYVRLFYLSP